MDLPREELKDLFDQCRGDNEALDMVGVMQLAQIIGYNPTKDDMDTFMKQLDLDNNGTVSLEEFYKFMEGQPADPDQELRDACKQFDKNGDGHMDKEELKRLLETDDEGEVDEFLSHLGVDSEGSIEIEEFIRLVNNKEMKPE